MRKTSTLVHGVVAAAATALVITGCSSSGSDGANNQIVLADGQELGDFNPLTYYGSLGVSPIYQGLLAPSADDDSRVPDLVPALAASAPERVAPRIWRVPLRTGVTFSDGTAFDAADVVATYDAVRDPKVASEIATDFEPIVAIAADGAAVKVTMATDADPSPYLLLGIVPSEKVQPDPVANWTLNTKPVGTGPYVLDSLEPDQAVLVARDDYWGEKPQLTRVVYTYTPDDNTRAQRVAAGEVDGANLPPKLAASIGERDGVTVVTAKSADWRGVTLPAGNAFTADPAARLAMNIGIDRDALIRDVLGGAGSPASNPISSVYTGVYDPAAQFTYDMAAAQRILDEAGWRPGSGGVREKDGNKASFELLYKAEDTVRRDLSVAFATAMKPLGISITPRGATWDEINPKVDTVAILLGGGDTPYSIDSQVYDTLHTRTAQSSPYANAGNFTAPGLDRLLDESRASAAGPENDARYMRIQTVYKQQPLAVLLTFLHHTYAVRDTGWKGASPIMEPHSHGVAWGPWWDLTKWERE